MSASLFEQCLNKLGMLKDETDSGLYFLDSYTDNLEVKIYLNEAKQYKPTAIYFVKSSNRLKPLIYIYNNTNNQYNIEDLSKLHKQLWNAYKVPMFFLIEATEIKVFNCLEKPNIENGDLKPVSPLEIINMTSNIISEFKANMFDSGAFWSTKYAHNFQYSNSVYEILLDELKKERKRLIDENILSQKTTDSLFMKSILLKYMEERGVFKKDYWKKFKDNANSFVDIFSDSKSLIKLFNDLSQHFNGGIFKLTDIERSEIENNDLSEFQYFLQGNKQGRQLLLWSIYSFKDLPIELISNIYELFLKTETGENKGIVYTPPILVDFMIDEIMPIDKPKKSFKVIDPACGSGVFLVGVYKRLIQWWIIQNGWKKPSVKTAKKLIKDNIYGIDTEKGAVQLSMFSLSLALCDTLQPDAIWNELKFDNLEDTGNILHKDFFEYVQDKRNLNKFDLVLGNPPFKSNTNSVHFTKLDKQEEKLRPKINNKNLKLPDKQLALFFLEQSFKFLKNDAYICLVQPSAFLYNNNVFEFRNYLLKKYLCAQVIDFACLNNSLFKRKGSGANVAVSTLFFQKKSPVLDKNNILHVTVRETFTAKEKIYFDLTHYDFHRVSYKEALTQKSIWKCNLMGGGRTKDIVKKLDSLPKLGEYLKEKVEQDEWAYSEGIQINGKDKYKEKHNNAYHITNKDFLPANSWTKIGIDNTKIYKLQETHFHRDKKRNKNIFMPPHLLIKEKLDDKKIIYEMRDDYLVFTHDTIGIYSPLNDVEKLKQIAKNLELNGKIYMFFLASISSQAGVSRATSLLKKDIDNIPYSENIDKLPITTTDQHFIDDVLDYMLDFCKGKKNSPLLKKATNRQLREYQNVFSDTLNTVYDNFKPYKIFESDSYIVNSFYYKNKPNNSIFYDVKLSDEDIDTVVKSRIGNSVYVTKILRLYDKNTIYFIKPKQYRFWLKSIAVRDADETFADLVKMGY